MSARSDQARITELYESEGRALFDFARHLGLNDAEAGDVLQESMLRLWREEQRGAVIDRPVSWLFRVVYRGAMQQHRLRRQLGRLLPRLAPQHPDYSGPEASDRLAVWAEVDRLPRRQRDALYLHYAADLPFREVASVLGISPSAARTHASRGTASLRQRLTAEELR